MSSKRLGEKMYMIWMGMRGGMLLGILLAFQMGLSQSPEDADVELDASPTVVARWVKYVDSIGKLDPAVWIADAQSRHLSQQENFHDVSKQIAPRDLEAYRVARKTGRLELKTAMRIFDVDSFGGNEARSEMEDSVDIKVLLPKGPIQAGDLEMIVVNGADESGWDAELYFIQNDCYLGRNSTYHKYGLQYGAGKLGGTQAVVWNNASLESGTGIWENEMQFTTVIDQHLVVAGWLPLEINLANPTTFCRHVETKVVKTNPFTVEYVWEVDLGYRYRGERPIFSGKTLVEYGWDAGKRAIVAKYKTGNLDDKKLLALSLFSPKELFVWAWRGEIKAGLQGKNVARRREVIEFLGGQY